MSRLTIATVRRIGGTALIALILGACSQATPPAPTSAPIEATQAPAATTAPPTAEPTLEASTAPPTSLPEPTSIPATAEPTIPAATPAPTGLAGSLVRGTVTKRPYVIMIDNHPNAYPQSGMNESALVFEALAEFGVTRFMVVYAPGITPEVDKIGPVRSTRLYFAQWALAFGGMYAHAGGSPQGLQLVESTDQLVNLDALVRANTGYFRRSETRKAPHNLYTSTAEIAVAASDLDADAATRDDIGYLFKDDAPAAERPASQQLSYFFLYREDSAGWVYDPDTNGYWRLRRGKAAVDADTGEQLTAKNVVVIEVKEAPIAGDAKGRIEQEVVGSGLARVFLDGVEREVTWRKDTPEAPLLFLDSNGQEVRFNPGRIWIVALPSLDNLATS
ncbi:MAG TPA: DUF3048 domain-containing protein [Roseiflexaceae bacterium]|nr:DUF3048 domain-containing protein [Roseiflexaceae bacterium]